MGLKGSQTMLKAQVSRLDGWGQASLLTGSRVTAKKYNILINLHNLDIFTLFSATLVPMARRGISFFRLIF
jgi:hypothetical protein